MSITALTTGNIKKTYGINEAKQEMMTGIRAYYATDGKGRYIYDPVNRLPFYLFGAPGIGKTEITKQVADELGIGFVSFSVTHHTRNSMIGLPVISDLENGEKYTQYTMSEVIAAVQRKVEEGFEKGILLLDEFNCASETIMPIMLAFLQTRNIGLFTLPEGWVIVLCGNPKEYNSSAKEFSAAINDRVRRMEIVPEEGEFFKYAEENGFNPFVMEYLKLYPHNMYKVTVNGDASETVTLRGWENLSRTMDAYKAMGSNLTPHTVRQFIKSDKISADFWNYYRLHSNDFDSKKAEQIINGKYGDDVIGLFDLRDASFAESALELIERELITNAAYDGPKTMSRKITNVFDFLEKVNRSYSLCEKFFLHLTDNEQLCDIVKKSKNEKYLQMARKMYGLAG
jgi:hypothetical protein